MPKGTPAAGYRKAGGGRKSNPMCKAGCGKYRLPRPSEGRWPQYCSDDCRRADTLGSDAYYARYGLTVGEYGKRLKDQGGRCMICPATEGGGGSRLHVDHDHESGVVRGLLCGSCNRMLGQGRDNPETLEAGARYLEWSAACQSYQ